MSDLSDNGLPPGRLSQHPDWRYLLREIYHLYRFSSAGGSANIRSHQKEVRHRLSRVLNDDPPVNMLQLDRPSTTPISVLEQGDSQGRQSKKTEESGDIGHRGQDDR